MEKKELQQKATIADLFIQREQLRAKLQYISQQLSIKLNEIQQPEAQEPEKGAEDDRNNKGKSR